MTANLHEIWTTHSLLRMERHTFSFYFILPLVLGIFFGLSQSGNAPLEGLTGHLIYWPISTFFSWQLLALGTSIASYFLRPIGTPLVVVLVIGNILGMVAWVPISDFRDIALSRFVQEGHSLGYARLSDLPVSIANWALSVSLWIVANYFYLYFFSMPRFGYQPNALYARKCRNWLLSDSSNVSDTDIEDKNESQSPRLYKRLNALESNPILALVAEDHYTRVTMPHLEELIYIRFSDAMEEMNEQPGIQVHRSYWVSSDAIADYSEKGHSASIRLSNNQTIPVSRSFRQIVRNALGSLESN